MRRATWFAGCMLVMAAAASCSDDIRLGNLPPEVTSVGPAWRGDDAVFVQITTFDREGDDIDLDVFVVQDGQATALPASAFEPPVLDGVANAEDEHTTHVLQWDWAASGVSDTAEISFRVQPRGEDAAAVELGPFTIVSLEATAPLPGPGDGSGEGSGEGSGDGSGS